MTERKEAPQSREIKVLEPGEDDVPEPLPARQQVAMPVAIGATSPVIEATGPNPHAEPSTYMTPEEARFEAASPKAKKHGGGL